MLNPKHSFPAKDNTGAGMSSFDLQLFAEGDPPANPPAGDPPANPPPGSPPPANPPAPGTPPPADPNNPQNPPADPNNPDLKVPDGDYDFGLPAEAKIDQDLAKRFTDIGKKYQLPNGAAKEFASMYQEQRQKEVAQFKEQIDQQVNAWAEETEKDPEIGGAKLEANLGIVNRALNAYDKGGKLRELLNVSGLGNHKDVVKFLMAVGNTVKEDSFPDGRDNAGEKPLGKIFYPEGSM